MQSKERYSDRHAAVATAYRHGDDSAAARWLLRYRRLRFRPQCLRYFRRTPGAYPDHAHNIITAYRAIQRRRR